MVFGRLIDGYPMGYKYSAKAAKFIDDRLNIVERVVSIRQSIASNATGFVTVEIRMVEPGKRQPRSEIEPRRRHPFDNCDVDERPSLATRCLFEWRWVLDEYATDHTRQLRRFFSWSGFIRGR